MLAAVDQDPPTSPPCLWRAVSKLVVDSYKLRHGQMVLVRDPVKIALLQPRSVASVAIGLSFIADYTETLPQQSPFCRSSRVSARAPALLRNVAAMFVTNPALGAAPSSVATRLRSDVSIRSRSRSTALRCTSSSEGLGTVHLLDYGAGNVRSVKNAIRRLGYNFIEVCCSTHPCSYLKAVDTVEHEQSGTWQVERVGDIAQADRLIFPGVGSYGQAMERLKQLGYTDALKDYIQVPGSARRFPYCRFANTLRCSGHCKAHSVLACSQVNHSLVYAWVCNCCLTGAQRVEA